MFSGYDSLGHPVRYVHELRAFLSTGNINFVSGDKVEKEHIWENDMLSTQDIRDYLSGEKYPTRILQLDKMIPYKKKMTCDTHEVRLHTFKLRIPVVQTNEVSK